MPAALMAHTLPFQGTMEAEATTHVHKQLCASWATGASSFPQSLAARDFPFVLAFLQLPLPLSLFLGDRV